VGICSKMLHQHGRLSSHPQSEKEWKKNANEIHGRRLLLWRFDLAGLKYGADYRW